MKHSKTPNRLVGWFKQYISDIYDDNKYPLKLAGISDKDGEKKAAFTVTGSYRTFFKGIDEAAFDNKLLLNLHPQDVRNLSMFVMYHKMLKQIKEMQKTIEQLKHRYEINGVNFDVPKSLIIKLYDVKDDHKFEIGLEELFANNDLLDAMNRDDCFTIGYLRCLYKEQEGGLCS